LTHLKGNLQDYRSIRAVGRRYRIIYQVKENEIEVIIVAAGIRRDGDKKRDLYELMKKYRINNILSESVFE